MNTSIKSRSIYKCDFLNGKVNKDASLNSVLMNLIEYNSQQNIVKETHFDKNEEIESLNEFFYDSEHHLIEQTHYEEGELAERISYQIDKNGFIEKEFKHYLDGSFDTIEYFYQEGKLSQKKYLDCDNELEHTEYFEWDGEHLAKEFTKDTDNVVVAEKSWVYDSNDHLIEMKIMDNYGEQALKTVYEYNEHGIKTLSKTYDTKGNLLLRNSYLLNDQNQVIQIMEEDMSGVTHIYLEYDENDNLIKQENYNSEEILIAKYEQTFNEDNLMLEYSAFVDKLGEGVNQNYKLTYTYTFY